MSNRLFDKRADPYFRIENVVLDRDDLDSNEKLVYIVLCRYANNNDGAFPSYSTIARKASISRPTVIRVVKKLLEKHLINKQERYKKSSKEKDSNFYYVMSAQPQGIDEELEENSSRCSKTVIPPSITQIPPSGKTVIPPSITQIPQVVSQFYPTTNNIQITRKNNNLYKKNHTQEIQQTPEYVDESTPITKSTIIKLKQQIFETLGESIGIKKIEELAKNSSIERIRYHLQNWHIHKKNQKKQGAGYFITVIQNDIEPIEPEKQPYNQNKIPQRDNFEQREYSDEFYESCYINLRGKEQKSGAES